MTPPLNAARIASLSIAARQDLAIEVLDSVPSTNAELRARAARLSGPLLLAAETQTAGRGRAGRRWHSAAGDSLCFSLAWCFSGPLLRLSGLSLAVGVAVAETLRTAGWPVQLKWPNDLLLEGAKLGGILIETAQAAGNASGVWAVIGIGLNVQPNAARDSGLSHAVASLSASSATVPDRNVLLAAMADALSTTLTAFDHDGLSSFVARWQALHAHQDCVVNLIEDGRLLHEGVARGIDDMGRLLLDTRDGRVAVTAGDVSLRAAGAAPSTGVQHATAD